MTQEPDPHPATFASWTDEMFGPNATANLKCLVIFVVSYVLAPFGSLLPLIESKCSSRLNKWVSSALYVAIGWFVASCLLGLWPHLDHYLPSTIKSTVLPTFIFGFFSGVTLAGIILNLFFLPFFYVAHVFVKNTRQSLFAVEGLLGHKLWAGENSYKFLKYLLEAGPVFGRAKWLLVDFLCTDIDRKIEHDPNKKTDSTGNMDEKLRSTHPIYKVTVHDWGVRTYSNFLSENMSHARKSINWVVDPIDLLTGIIPAHVVEIVVSLGSFFDADLKAKVEDAMKALKSNRAIKWGSLLDTYANWCLRPCTRHNESTKCTKDHANCPENFPFIDKSQYQQMDYLWYAIFIETLRRLAGASADVNAESIVISGGKSVNYEEMLSKYKDRETIVGSLVLPHINEFRKAPCSKRRHLYLGSVPGKLNDCTKRDVGTAKLKSHITNTSDYVRCINPEPEGPQPDGSQYQNGLFARLLRHKMDGPDKIACQPPLTDADDIWKSVNEDVKRLILLWGINLLSHTSGGVDFIKGVFLRRELNGDEMVYPGCHDIGFYDGRLVLSSGRGKIRDVTWRVYQEASELEDLYFPDKAEQIVDFPELSKIILQALV